MICVDFLLPVWYASFGCSVENKGLVLKRANPISCLFITLTEMHANLNALENSGVNLIGHTDGWTAVHIYEME